MPYLLAVAYAGLTLAALIVAALLPVPRLYVPLYFCGLGLGGLLVEVARLVYARVFGVRAAAGMTVSCGIAALAVHYVGTQLTAAHPPTPEPVLLGQLFIGQLEAVLAVAAVFFGLQAERDRLAAWLGLGLALCALVLIGMAGTATYFDQMRALSSIVAATAALVAIAVQAVRARRH